MTIRTSIAAAWLGLLAAVPAPGAAQQDVAASASAQAQAPAVRGADSWLIYGTQMTLRRDVMVVGGGSVVAAPLAAPADPWTSGAVAAIPQALAAGESITVAFWAKAAAAETVALTFQEREAPYARFLDDRLALTPHWQLFVRTAVAPAPLAAGTQAVVLQLGRIGSEVALGPLAVLDGAADQARVEAAFAAFRPDRVGEAVSIESDPGVTLAGTLRTPNGRGAGPFPLAIVIQGNGRNGRGAFDLVMDRLLADGIATLEYDKRGVGSSTGAYEEDVTKLTRDARAAVAAMRRREEIDGSRIALLGHSQGGVIAPAVAAADPRIAAIVNFGAPVGDGIELFARSMHDRLVASGRSETTVAPLVDASVALLRARVDGAGDAALAPLQAAVIDGLVANGFTRDQAAGALAAVDNDEVHGMTQVRIASDLRSLRIPVLQLFGSLDPLVIAPGNAAAAREALARNPAGRVEVLDGLSHWFKEGAITGTEEENATLGPNIGSPRVVKLVGDWLRDALATAPAQ